MLKIMLDGYNIHATSFRMATKRIMDCSIPDMKLRLISERSTDRRI